MIYVHDRISDIYNQPSNDLFFELWRYDRSEFIILSLPQPFELANEFSIIRTSLTLSLDLDLARTLSLSLSHSLSIL